MGSPTITGVLSEIRRQTHNTTHQQALDEAISILDPRADHELSALELESKYTGSGDWGECPEWPRWDWRQEVASESTLSGYWEWVFNKVQSEEQA